MKKTLTLLAIILFASWAPPVQVDKPVRYTSIPKFDNGFEFMGVPYSTLSSIDTNNFIRVLNVKSFGAKGDGQRYDDATLSISSDILQSDSATFTQSDVGKSISVQKASGANTVAGTILAVNNAHEIQLSFSASANQSDVIFWYGTDDTEAIQSAINYWNNNGKTGTIYLPDGIYIIAGAPQHNIGGLDMYGQLYIPFTAFASDQGDRANLVITGETPALGFWAHRDQVEAGNVGVARSKKGTIIKSNYTTAESIGSSVFGTNGVGVPYAYNYTCTHFRNLQIIVDAKIGGAGPVLGGINMSKCYATYISECGVAVDEGLGASQQPSVSRVTVGINIGPISDDQPNVIRNTNVSGFYVGITGGEHGYLDYVSILGCYYGLKMNTSGYGLYATTMQIYWCKNSIWNNASGGYNTYLDISRLEIEHNILGSYWYDNAFDVVDQNNEIIGVIHSISVNDSIKKDGGVNLLMLYEGQNIPIWTDTTRPNADRYVIGLNIQSDVLEVYDTVSNVFKTISFDP